MFTAPADATLQRCLEETRDARWFTWEELATVDLDPAARRMFDKARAIVGDE